MIVTGVKGKQPAGRTVASPEEKTLKFYGFSYTLRINTHYSAYLPCFLLFNENVKLFSLNLQMGRSGHFEYN